MSGLIPQPFIDEILQRCDIVELIDGFVPLKKRGTSYTACCPFHHEKSPSFYVIAKKQYYHCFGCGAAGNAVSFVMNYLNQTFPQAIETLANRSGLTVPKEQNTEKHKEAQDLYQLMSKVCAYYQQTLKEQGQTAIAYLKNRGLSGSIAKAYQIGYAKEGWHELEKKFPRYSKELLLAGMLVQNEQNKVYDRYRNRVMFPIHDRNGKIIGFGGRVLDNQKPKYLNSPETPIFQKNRELYGLYQVISQHKDNDSIIIVEGYMDVISLAQFGIHNAVATLGTATSTYHIQLLAKYTKRIVFCFDGDTAGQQAAWKALESCLPHLASGLDVGFMFLPEEHDPDSLIRQQGPQHFLEQLKTATPLPKYLLTMLTKDIELSNLSGKTQLIEKAKPMLQKIPEGSYKALLLDDIARITHLEHHRLNSLLQEKTTKIEEPNKSIARTPIRIAIALLLQNPDIYATLCTHVDIAALNDIEQPILSQLLQQLEKNPEANTATLIEQWRTSSYFDVMSKLAFWDHQVPDAELTQELTDILAFLQKQNQETMIKKYINKSRHEGLNEEEKLTLQALLQSRHQQ